MRNSSRPRPWLEVVSGAGADDDDGRRPTEDFCDDIEHCLSNEPLINDWEANFCFQLLSFPYLSIRQQQKLRAITRKVDAGIALKRRRR